MAFAKDLFGHNDYILVRAELVRALDGDAVAAIVLSRIYWRCQGPDAVQGWWRGTVDTLSAETGLSADQIRKAVARLKTAGHVATSKQRAGGTWDQTLSYSVVISETLSAPEPDEEPAPEPDLPLLETLKTHTARVDEDPEATRGKGSDYRFTDAWAAYPARRGRKIGKALALKEWRKLTYEQKARAWRAVQNMRGEELPPDMERWLRSGKWEDWVEAPSQPPPQTAPTQTAPYSGGVGVQRLPNGKLMGPMGEEE